jgi:hypothetical protein
MPNVFKKELFRKLKVKIFLQRLIRRVNVLLFSKNLPNKISIYFHETDTSIIKQIEDIVNFFTYLEYTFVTIDEFNKNIKKTDLKQIALTFDDGYNSWLECIKLLEKLNVKGTFYINSINFIEDDLTEYMNNINFSDRLDILTLENFLKLSNSSHQIGSHTHSHPTLSTLSNSQFKYQIEENLNFFDLQNITINSFAIPFGMRRYIKKNQLKYLNTIFETVCFGEPGMQFYQKSNKIQRSPWIKHKPFEYNIVNIKTNSSIFNNLIKRSGLG